MSVRLLLVRALYWLRSLREDPTDLFRVLGVKSDDRILEVGCAIGYHTLAELAPEGMVYAVDIWEEGLRFLRSRVKSGWNVELICRGAEEIELPSGSLDKIFCFDTLHELPLPGKALQRWAGFLKGDGRLYFKDPKMLPQEAEKLSQGRLQEAGSVRGISIFAKGK